MKALEWTACLTCVVCIVIGLITHDFEYAGMALSAALGWGVAALRAP